MSGKKPPVGKGYYDDEGKFVRMLPVQADLTGRDGIGVDFAPKNLDLPAQATSLRCDICSVSVTCLPQMDMHLQGQKHQKKLKLNGLAFASPSPAVDSKVSAEMYSSFRLPSGQFYCKTCNLSLNSDSQFGAHLQSKNHAKKADRAAAAEAATAAVV